MGRHYGRALGLLATVALAAVASSACHDEGDTRVSSLKFEGNRVFSSGRLADLLVTRASGWLPWSRRRYFNRAVFDADLDRLIAFYEDRGYPEARIASVDVDFTPAQDAVRLRIHLDEGAPLIVERVAFTGFEGAPQDVTDALSTLPLQAGGPRDRQVVAASRERATFLLRDHGYPNARVESHEAAGARPGQVVVTLKATPGPAATFGPISVVGLRSVHESLIRRTLSFETGELYRESLVMESQRRLQKLGIFEFAHVGANRSAESPEAATSQPMTVTLSEGRPTRLQLGVGYGSEDGPRGSVRWEHLNFLGDARRFTTESKYSARLRGTGVEFVEPYFLTSTVSLSARVGGWWTDEPTYTSRRFGGRWTVTHRREAERGADLEPIDHVIRVGYVTESLRYAIDPKTLADLTQFEQFIALGLDPVTGLGAGRLAAIDVDLERTAVDHPADPHAGHAASLHVKHASPWLGGTYRYDEVLTEGRVYVPLGTRHVWASRARIGAIFADASAVVPVSERYFLGGSTNLRGWGRYQVAPLTADGLPVGGRALLDVSTELRFALGGAFGAVAFVDAGNVWTTPAAFGRGQTRIAAGPGLRWISPIGIVRADLGIQLTPIRGLKVAGQPEPRRWRIHFSIGHAF